MLKAPARERTKAQTRKPPTERRKQRKPENPMNTKISGQRNADLDRRNAGKEETVVRRLELIAPPRWDLHFGGGNLDLGLEGTAAVFWLERMQRKKLLKKKAHMFHINKIN
jgi:hypothetical protein